MFYISFLETLVLNANYEDIVVGSSQISTFNFSAKILHFADIYIWLNVFILQSN